MCYKRTESRGIWHVWHFGREFLENRPLKEHNNNNNNNNNNIY